MILKLIDLGCGYNSGFNLAGISLKVCSGEILVLNGKNGTGKTTLLRSIIGLKSLNSGQITVDGKEVTNDLDAKGEIFSYFGHVNGLKDQLTIRENLRYWFDIFGEAKSNIYNDFELNNIMDRKVSDCSSGQKRLVGLARIFNRPKAILLLDEPTVGLDHINRKKIHNKISQHAKNGGIAIIASHDTFPSSKVFTITSKLISSPNSAKKDLNLFFNFKV